MKVSICIPTYKRPEFLKIAMQSCFDQIDSPCEILIGDDSPDDATEEMVNALEYNNAFVVKYFHNKPSKGQAQNINSLFDKVNGDFVLLLHDDDELLDSALKTLCSVFEKHPYVDAAFGKQYLMNNAGVVDENKSIGLNNYYLRDKEHEGSKLSPKVCSFRQFPNDCYMLRKHIIDNVRYDVNAGDACDFDFGIQVGKVAKQIYFVNEYTMKYRDSEDAVSKRAGHDAAIKSFELVEKLEIDDVNYKYKEEYLKAMAPMAIGDCIGLGLFKRGWDIYLSKWHHSKILTPGGLRRFIQLLAKRKI